MNIPSSSRIGSTGPLEHSPFPRAWLQGLRKLAIISLFALTVGPLITLNLGVNLEKAGHTLLGARMRKAVPFLDALLLRQQWTLFTDISAFNYTTHFEVVMKDGSTVQLHDSAPQNATGWTGLLFYSEPKIRNNLYGYPTGHSRYLEYLIRLNGIQPAEVSKRIIYIRYRNLLPRPDATTAGTHYGPEIRYDLQSY